jgi:hypothetical protein
MKKAKLPTLISRLFIYKDGKYVVLQFPNAPLMVAIVAYGLRLVIDAQPLSNYLGVVIDISLGIWAIMEIIWGVNLFRRIFGLVVIGFILFGLIMG